MQKSRSFLTWPALTLLTHTELLLGTCLALINSVSLAGLEYSPSPGRLHSGNTANGLGSLSLRDALLMGKVVSC